MKPGLMILIMGLFVTGCSSSSKVDPTPADQRQEQLRQQKDCDDPQWKASHLGIWYNVCRDNKAL